MTHWTQVLSNVSAGGVRPAGRAHDAAVGAPPHPRRRVGRALLRHPRRAVPDGQDRSRPGHEPERGQVADRPAAGDALLPVPLRRDVPDAEPRGPRSWPSPSPSASSPSPSRCTYLPAPGFPPPPHFLAYRVSFVVAFGFLFSYVVVRLFVAGRGEPPIAATRMHLLAIAVAGLEVQVVVAALGLQGPTVESGHAGAHRGDGRPVPDGARAPVLRAGLLEPQGGRGLPPGRRRAGVGRRLARTWPSTCCPTCARSSARRRPPSWPATARSWPAIPVWPDSEGPDAVGRRTRGARAATGRRITVRTHSGATHVAGRQDQPLHAVLRQRGAAQARPAGRAWSGSPSSAARWPSRWPSRPRTTD